MTARESPRKMAPAPFMNFGRPAAGPGTFTMNPVIAAQGATDGGINTFGGGVKRGNGSQKMAPPPPAIPLSTSSTLSVSQEEEAVDTKRISIADAIKKLAPGAPPSDSAPKAATGGSSIRQQAKALEQSLGGRRVSQEEEVPAPQESPAVKRPNGFSKAAPAPPPAPPVPPAPAAPSMKKSGSSSSVALPPPPKAPPLVGQQRGSLFIFILSSCAYLGPGLNQAQAKLPLKQQPAMPSAPGVLSPALEDFFAQVSSNRIFKML